MSRPALALAFALAASACRSAPEAAPRHEPPRGSAAPAPGATGSARALLPTVSPGTAPADPGFEYSETLSGGAHEGDRLPLILALHGLGDRPASFLHLFDGFPCPARIVAPHSGTRHGPGFSWFAFHREDPGLAGPEIAARADELAAFARRLARDKASVGRPLLTGFSQGGALSFAIAARHGTEISGAFPVGGWLPDTVSDNLDGQIAPIVAFHGADDPLITVDRPRAAALRLRKDGFAVELAEFPGVGHQIPREVQGALFERLGAACERERSGEPPPGAR